MEGLLPFFKLSCHNNNNKKKKGRIKLQFSQNNVFSRIPNAHAAYEKFKKKKKKKETFHDKTGAGNKCSIHCLVRVRHFNWMATLTPIIKC